MFYLFIYFIITVESLKILPILLPRFTIWLQLVAKSQSKSADFEQTELTNFT